MKTLVIGTGGREHALAWALSRDPGVTEVHAAPGNPGVAQVATLHPVDPMDGAAVAALATALGVALPPTLAFECPTIEAVARFVAHEALGWPREDAPAAADAHSALAEPAEDDLSEDSLTLLLAQKLDSLR